MFILRCKVDLVLFDKDEFICFGIILEVLLKFCIVFKFVD